MIEKNKKKSTEPEIFFDRADERIARAAKGLIFISETDAPMEPFRWKKANEVTAGVVREMTGIDADSPAEEADADDFFSKLTVKKEWFGEREIERAERFAELYTELRSDLRDLRMFRFGRVQVSIYIVGIDAEGYLAGVMTKAVET